MYVHVGVYIYMYACMYVCMPTVVHVDGMGWGPARTEVCLSVARSLAKLSLSYVATREEGEEEEEEGKSAERGDALRTKRKALS